MSSFNKFVDHSKYDRRWITHKLHELQDRAVFIVDIVESLRFLKISGPPRNNGAAPPRDFYPSVFFQILLQPSTLRVSDRRRLYDSCLSEKEWNCRWEEQLHGSSPLVSRFSANAIVLIRLDHSEIFVRLID